MTTTEMTELFSVMMLAWPNAEMFKGGLQKLAPTIKLWTQCLSDISFQRGQQVVIHLCKTSKYPPTISEFRDAAKYVEANMMQAAENAFCMLKGLRFVYGSLNQAYAALPPESLVHRAITAMGGPEKLVISCEPDVSIWNENGFIQAYLSVLGAQQLLKKPKMKELK